MENEDIVGAYWQEDEGDVVHRTMIIRVKMLYIAWISKVI